MISITRRLKKSRRYQESYPSTHATKSKEGQAACSYRQVFGACPFHGASWMWMRYDEPPRHPYPGSRFRSQVLCSLRPWLALGCILTVGLTVPRAFDPRISQNSLFPIMVLVRSVRNSFAMRTFAISPLHSVST